MSCATNIENEPQVGVLFAERMDQMGLEVVVRDVYEDTPAAATGLPRDFCHCRGVFFKSDSCEP